MKKKVLTLLASMVMLVLFISTCFADYPIFYQRYAADPSALEYNGRLYVYASHDVYKAGAGYTITDVTCISTDDMKNWTDHGEVFKASGWAGATWAPAVVYRNGKFYLYYGNGGNGIGVAVSSSPTEGFKDPLGRALVNNSTPGVNAPANFWCFDPGAFVDTDGQAYLYWGGNGEGNTRVIKLNSDMISVNGSASKITAPRFFEDSWINKYNGKYYYSYSTNFSQGAATIDYMMSDSPTSGFVHKGTILANPPSNDGNNNHHSIVQFKGNWYIAYHNHALSIQNGITDSSIRAYQRSLCMDRLYFNTDGTIKPVAITKDGMTQLKSVDPYSTNEAETVAQSSGVQTESCSEGGRDVCNVENGDWVMIKGVDFGSAGAKSFNARVAAAGNGGNIEIRLDSATGTLVGSCTVQKTGASQTWTTKTCTVSGATGKHDLFLKFTGSGSNMLNLNWWNFSNGTTPTTTPTATVAPTPTPTVTVAPTATPSTNKIECENMTLGGTYAGKIASPFTGVALYGNNDYCKYTQNFGLATHSFSVRGCSNNSGTARVDLKIGGRTVGTFSFTGTTPTVQTLSNISHGTGDQEVTLTITTDNGSWDAYVDYLQFN